MKLNKSLLIMALSLFAVSGLVAKEQSKKDEVPGVAAQPTSYFYTGKPYDADLGAYTFNFRNYDPELKRWTSIDPSGFPDGANNIIYAPTPTFALDIFGLSTTYVRTEIYYKYYNFTNTTPFSMVDYYKAVAGFVPVVGEALDANEVKQQMMNMTGSSIPDDFFSSSAFQDALDHPREGWTYSHDDWDYSNGWGIQGGPDGPAPDMNKVISEDNKGGTIITYLNPAVEEGQQMVVKQYFTHTVVTE